MAIVGSGRGFFVPARRAIGTRRASPPGRWRRHELVFSTHVVEHLTPMSLLTVAFTILGSAGNLAGNDRSQHHGLAHAAPAAAVAREYMSGLQPQPRFWIARLCCRRRYNGHNAKAYRSKCSGPADYRDSARERRMVLALFAPHPYSRRRASAGRRALAARSGLLSLGSQPAAPRPPPRHSPSIEIGRPPRQAGKLCASSAIRWRRLSGVASRSRSGLTPCPLEHRRPSQAWLP